MKKNFVRSKKLDLSLTFIPEEKVQEILLYDLNNNLFNLEKWHLELTSWIELICLQDDFLCPKAVCQSDNLSIGLQFTDDSTISKLNSKWRQKKEVTDVLSFPLIDNENIFPNFESLELGDIVISVATASRQSKEYQHDLERELRWLVSHGLLHLLGWDHPDEESLNKMLNAQEQLLGINVNL